jgi:aryl-alcohol dehydrogenase-like predicted oxidoreductase
LRYRKLGSTDLEVSEVGVAVAGLTGGRAPRADEDVLHLLRRALDLGITFFDTEDAGGDDGRGETLLGETVRRERERVTVATTFGYRPLSPLEQATSGERRRHDWSVAWAGRALDHSLSRLGLEPVDLWQLHHPGMTAIESDELFEFLDQQVAKGKIRAYGVALGPGTGWADEGIAAMRERRVAAVRTRYSVFEQEPGRELAEVAAETGSGMVARMPVDSGLPDPRLRQLEFLTADRDQTLGQALVRFALAVPPVVSVLPVFGDEGRLAELAIASDLPDLTQEDLDQIAERQETGFALPDGDGDGERGQRGERSDVEDEA